MINNLLSLLTFEKIYLIANWGVIPFWLLLIVLPNHQITNFFVHSIIIPLLISTAYGYLSYNIFLDGNILDGFELYNGLDGLYSMFSSEALLLVFWLHFLTISLFAGAWIVRDSKKYFIPKAVTVPSLILTYLSGPVGLVFYWFIRIFFAKKITFND
ncbi:ABA4-like family protein [Pelagibacteraceae bacterium]|nr:ABA4-like family protein [Pelagibacteraceae bacterium]